jgi:histidine ammonia-lyase
MLSIDVNLSLMVKIVFPVVPFKGSVGSVNSGDLVK